MAESNKKHSRKSKLVPRECIEIEDVVATSAELEEAVQSIPSSEPSTSLLPKIKNTINEDSFKKNSLTPVELSVQVQVESCSDDEQEETSLYVDDDENYVKERMKMLAKLPKKEIIIYTDTLREEIDKTAQKIKTIADKQLDIFVRNSLWKNIKVFELDHYETLLQEVLTHWRVWMCMSKIRAYVLAYKCNICCQGWWQLQPFESHIRLHKNLTLRLETYHHDCVITAEAENWYESICQIHFEGNCPRCLKPYENHIKEKRSSLYYICEGCGDRFPTCQNLFTHEGQCVKYEKIIYANANAIPHEEQWRCQVCDTSCLTEWRYTQHLLGCHDVRSDEPVQMHNSKDCNQCGNKYFVYSLHCCPMRADNFKCSYCFRKFQNKSLQVVHENNFNACCYCPVCNKFFKKQCMLYEHLVRHSKYYAIAFKCQDCSDNVIVPTEKLMSTHKAKCHPRRHDRNNLYETMIVPVQCLTLKFCEPLNVADMVIGRKPKSVHRNNTSKEVLETLTSIVQVRREYTESIERDRMLAESQRDDEIQHNTVVNNISKELANKFIKRANNLQGNTNYESEIEQAVDSLKFETNDTNTNDKYDYDDKLTIDDDLAINDDDIGETESSVNALLNQCNIKQEIYIEEPYLTHYMDLDYVSRESFNQNEDDNIDNDSRESAEIIVKTELMCHENFETGEENTHLVTVKQEPVDPELIVIEDSQESEITEVNVLQTEPTNDSKEHFKMFKTEIVIKEEPLDSTEIDTNKIKVTNNVELLNNNISNEEYNKPVIEHKSEKVEEHEDTNEIKVTNNVELRNNNISNEEHNKPIIEYKSEKVEEHEVKVKEEKEEYLEFDSDIEDAIEREQEACLEELSKVFKAAKSSKEVKLSNICVDEVKVKDEPMDIENEIEHDIIIKNTRQSFKVAVNSEDLNSSSDRNSDETSLVDPSHLEPEVNISTDKNVKVSTHKNKKRLYNCNKCDFEGEHQMYVLHVQETCPKSSKKPGSHKKELWSDMKCTKCGRRFLTLRKYLTHLSHVHYLRYNTCPQCNRRFPNLSATLTHLTMHIKKGFLKIQVLKELVYYTSQSSGVHQCKVCNEEVSFKNFFSHWEAHQDLKFECDDERDLVIDESVDMEVDSKEKNQNSRTPDLNIKQILEQLLLPADDREVNLKRCCACARNFDRRNDCKRHLIEHLLKDAYAAAGHGLMCQLCKSTFQRPDRYKVHMRQHGSLPVFKCEMCNKCFSDSSNFAKHKKVHNLQALKCDTCKRKFQSKNQLEKHMELHRTTQPSKCDICERVFPLPTEYKKHMRSNHSSRSGMSYCTICRKREMTKRDLWDHMWLVHKVRHSNADCLICDKSFRKYVEVRAHMRTAHQLNTKVTIKTLQSIQALSPNERAEKIRELLSTTVTVENPSTDETFVIYE